MPCRATARHTTADTGANGQVASIPSSCVDRDMRAWLVQEFGAPADVLLLEEVDPPEPGPGEVQIAVEAVTINFNDIDGIRGRYRTVHVDPPYIPGMEVLGRVLAAGDGAGALIGNRVSAIPVGAFGGYAEVAVAPVAMTFAMPDDMDTAIAASVYMPFHVASLALYERADVSADDTVLVHAAAGARDRPPCSSLAHTAPE